MAIKCFVIDENGKKVTDHIELDQPTFILEDDGCFVFNTPLEFDVTKKSKGPFSFVLGPFTSSLDVLSPIKKGDTIMVRNVVVESHDIMTRGSFDDK